MTEVLSLAQLVDLALGTPEVGAVNFNVLHTLLHAVLSKLSIGGIKAEISGDDRAYLSSLDRSAAQPSRASTIGKDSGHETDQEIDEVIPKKRSHYHQLEVKILSLEEKIDMLNALPSNEDLFNRTRDSSKQRPVSDMWQTMQLAKRVDANETGVGKLMSMVEDMLKEMQDLRNDNDRLRRQISDLNVEDIMKKLKSLEDLTKSLSDQFKTLPRPPGKDFFDAFVTWEGLENAMKGVRDDLRQPTPPPVVEVSLQTDPIRPPSTKPSKELSLLLEKLGVLTDRHDTLQVRVDVIEEELKNKANKEDLDSIKVPDDLYATLNQLQKDIDTIQKARDRDSDALTRVQRAINNLQAEIDKLRTTTDFLSDENTSRSQQMSDLVETTTQLEEKKVDKDYVDASMELKADKRALESKVSRNQFDSVTQELNKTIDEILSKLDGHDAEWKRALSELTKELDCKIDRLELDALKDYLESKLKALSAKIKAQNYEMINDDDAAGLRRQLLQRYNCISCDRPIDVYPQVPVAALPSPSGLPGMRSARPYTTFELEQIRQQEKLFGYPDMAEQLYSSIRSCGGAHTMTHPHRRITKLTQLATLFHDGDTKQALKEELDIMGADGHIYKGRLDRLDTPKLPKVLQQNSVNVDRAVSPRFQRIKTAMSPISHVGEDSQRPMSARVWVQSPSHAVNNSRPTSARALSSASGINQIPAGLESPRPPACERAKSPVGIPNADIAD